MKLFNCLIICFIICPLFGQSSWITLSDRTQLYAIEAGKGQALIFIPGWTMTSHFFEKQMALSKEGFRVITFDPRGQGRSTKTTYHNNYAVHARDLQEVITQKELKNVVLIGWSSGCLTVYEYLRAYGKQHIDKIVLIDEPPKWIGDPETDWVYGTFDDYRKSLIDMVTQSESKPDGIINWMLEEPVDSLTMQWMRAEIMLTPRYVALPLYINGLSADYTEELTTFSPQVPTLLMVRSTWQDKVASWLQKNAPKAELVPISSHAMFWEKPAVFNQMLSKFLKNH